MRNDELRPRVGIFFVYETCLLIEGTPVNEAQPYGDFMGHAKGHPPSGRTYNGTTSCHEMLNMTK
jgi:hypothetical protein